MPTTTNNNNKIALLQALAVNFKENIYSKLNQIKSNNFVNHQYASRTNNYGLFLWRQVKRELGRGRGGGINKVNYTGRPRF